MLLALACTANAETITGLVVGVSDGDTITVLDANKVQHKIRLAGIDAPEKKQTDKSSNHMRPSRDRLRKRKIKHVKPVAVVATV